MKQGILRTDSILGVPLEHAAQEINGSSVVSDVDACSGVNDFRQAFDHLQLFIPYFDVVPSSAREQASHEYVSAFLSGHTRFQGEPHGLADHYLQKDGTEGPHVEGPGLRDVAKFGGYLGSLGLYLQCLRRKILRCRHANIGAVLPIERRTPINDLDFRYSLVIVADQNVVWLQVGVHDACLRKDVQALEAML